MRHQAVVLTAALLVSAAVTGCTSSGDSRLSGEMRIHTTADPDAFRGVVPGRPFVQPDLTFVDTEGLEFNLATDTRKPATLVFFGYTHCEDVCPLVLAAAASALNRLDVQTREGVQVVFITTDPARDTPSAIRRYLDRFDPSFVGLTGEMSVIKEAARKLGVPIAGRSPFPGGGYAVGHGAMLVGFDVEGRGRVIWPEGTPVGDLRYDITKLVAAAAS